MSGEGLVALLTQTLEGETPDYALTFNTMPPAAGGTGYFPIDAMLGLNLETPALAAAVTQHNAYLAENCAGENMSCERFFVLATSPHNTAAPTVNLMPADSDFIDELTGEVMYW